MFYIGRMGQQWGQPNWIETYEVVDKSDAMQYMHLGDEKIGYTLLIDHVYR